MVAAAQIRGESAIGYRLAANAADPDKADGVVINPDKAEPVTPKPDPTIPLQ